MGEKVFCKNIECARIISVLYLEKEMTLCYIECRSVTGKYIIEFNVLNNQHSYFVKTHHKAYNTLE